MKIILIKNSNFFTNPKFIKKCFLNIKIAKIFLIFKAYNSDKFFKKKKFVKFHRSGIYSTNILSAMTQLRLSHLKMIESTLLVFYRVDSAAGFGSNGWHHYFYLFIDRINKNSFITINYFYFLEKML